MVSWVVPQLARSGLRDLGDHPGRARRADGAAQVSKGLPKARDLLAPQAQQLIMARDDWIFTARPWVFACARRAAFESAEAVTQQLTAMFAVFASMPHTVVPSTAEEPGDALVRFLLDAPTLPDAQSRLESLSPADRELVERRSHRWCSSGKNCKCRLRYRKPVGMPGVKIACVLWVAGCQVKVDSIRGAYTLSSVTERTGR